MKDKLRDMAKNVRAAASISANNGLTYGLAFEAADFLQSMADITDQEPDIYLRYVGFNNKELVSKDYADWHIKQHALTKAKLDAETTALRRTEQELAEAKRRIAELTRESATKSLNLQLAQMKIDELSTDIDHEYDRGRRHEALEFGEDQPKPLLADQPDVPPFTEKQWDAFRHIINFEFDQREGNYFSPGDYLAYRKILVGK